MRILVYLLILFDFVLRPFLWKIYEAFIISKYGIVNQYDERLAPTFRLYAICDTISYLLLYILIRNKDKLADDRVSQTIILAAIPFAINKVFEAVFMSTSELDWTELIFFMMSVTFVMWKLHTFYFPASHRIMMMRFQKTKNLIRRKYKSK